MQNDDDDYHNDRIAVWKQQGHTAMMMMTTIKIMTREEYLDATMNYAAMLIADGKTDFVIETKKTDPYTSYCLKGPLDGSITVIGSGNGDAIRHGPGEGGAHRHGSGNGDARRYDDGKGDALRSGLGDGDAIRLGPGNGDALRYGPGNGNALRCGSGKGYAWRYGHGNGDAFCVTRNTQNAITDHQ